MSETSTNPPNPNSATVTRRVVVLRPKNEQPERPLRRLILIIIATFVILGIGLAIGFRATETLTPPPPVSSSDGKLSERVSGGLYALEIATPAGQARWMLEFDAEIITKDGPSNPLQLRDALEKLVIHATSLPIVNMSEDPTAEMRIAMLAIAAEHYPWLIDVYMRRSDIRANAPKLSEFGEALRNIGN